MNRGRINGRHFSIIAAVQKGGHVVVPSHEHYELEAWGYIVGEPEADKIGYRLTELGEKSARTWADMKEPT